VIPVSARALGSALGEIVGRERVSDDPGRLAGVAIDGLTPRWLVSPVAAEQVAGLLALAHEERLAVVPRGSGSALDLGRLPARVDVVLDLAGLDRVLDDNPDDLTISVEAGVLASGLAARLGRRGQWLPVDPPGGPGRTLGGLTATNAHGPLRFRYGTLRDLLLGVRFVQADGVVTWGGARVVKSVTGYDVPKLMVGALGTLGVLVELTVRLHPRPEFERTWLASFTSSSSAEAFVGLVLDSTLQPNRIELLNEPALRACAVPTAPAAIAVAIGSVEAAVDEQGVRLGELARQASGRPAPAPDNFWERYDRAFARPRDGVVLQVGTLPGRLAATVAAIERGRSSRETGASIMIAGCAALGALRVVLGGAALEGAAALIERLRGVVADFDGSVVVQAGPAALRAAIDPWGPVAPEAFALMRGLRDEFDPRRVLNPGRFVGGL